MTTVTDPSTSRALLGKGSVYTVGTAMQLVGALLVLPALSRLLPRAEYGRVALALVVTNLLGLVITLGLPAVITREHFSDKSGARTPVLVTLTTGLAFGLGLLALVTGPLWAAPFGGFDVALALGTWTAITYAVILTGQAVLRARGQAIRFVLLVGINVLGGQLLGLAGIVLINATAAVYLGGLAIGSLAAAVLGFAWASPSFTGLFDRDGYREWFSIALPTLPHTAALFLMTAGDRFVVELQRGADGVAAYSLAYQAGAVGISLIAAANNAWAPLIYGAPEQRRWQILATTTHDMSRVGAVVASGIALAAPFILWVIADPDKYDIDDLVPVVAVTALATLPYILYLSSAHVLFWSGKTMALLWITPLAVVVNLVGKALVLPWAGFVGAAVVTVLAYALLAGLIGRARRGIAAVPWLGRWPAVGVAIAGCLLGAALPITWPGLLARAALLFVAVAIGLTVIREIWRARSVIKPAS